MCERHRGSERSDGTCYGCDIERRLNADPVIRQLLGSGPRYRYWKVDRPRYHRTFEYTTERADEDKFWAVERRWENRLGTIVRKVGFRQRQKAKARAYEWYTKASALTPATS